MNGFMANWAGWGKKDGDVSGVTNLKTEDDLKK